MSSQDARRYMMDWYSRASNAKPFLRWAGGKRPFLYRFADEMPAFPGSYIEPFLGSGSVFFHLMAKEPRITPARLGDTNKHLVRCFIDVRDDPGKVHQELEVLQAGYDASADKSDFYYQVRDAHNAFHPKSNAARFIFLNRTCWNGLYRVNQQGKFNVPYGSPKTGQVIPTLEELENASAALAQAHIRATSWQNTVAFAQPGDFVFLDPPYFSDIKNGHETKYSTKRFTLREHEELARTLAGLADQGVDFLLTNSGCDEMIELYSGFGLDVKLVEVPRYISSKTKERGGVPELIVRSSGDRRSKDSSAEGINEKLAEVVRLDAVRSRAASSSQD